MQRDPAAAPRQLQAPLLATASQMARGWAVWLAVLTGAGVGERLTRGRASERSQPVARSFVWVKKCAAACAFICAIGAAIRAVTRVIGTVIGAVISTLTCVICAIASAATCAFTCAIGATNGAVIAAVTSAGTSAVIVRMTVLLF